MEHCWEKLTRLSCLALFFEKGRYLLINQRVFTVLGKSKHTRFLTWTTIHRTDSTSVFLPMAVVILNILRTRTTIIWWRVTSTRKVQFTRLVRRTMRQTTKWIPLFTGGQVSKAKVFLRLRIFTVFETVKLLFNRQMLYPG